MEIEKNTVSAVRQVKDEHVVQIVDKGAKLNVLFIGNSITRHAPKESIGWSGNWGMAASCEERDYVHVVVAGLEEKYGPVNFCTVCGADWERSYWDSAELVPHLQRERPPDFRPGALVRFAMPTQSKKLPQAFRLGGV